MISTKPWPQRRKRLSNPAAITRAQRERRCVASGEVRDFRPLVEALQRKGVRVSVVSTIRSQPPMIADELRRQCDNFIELDELRDVVGRPPREPRDEPTAEMENVE